MKPGRRFMYWLQCEDIKTEEHIVIDKELLREIRKTIREAKEEKCTNTLLAFLLIGLTCFSFALIFSIFA